MGNLKVKCLVVFDIDGTLVHSIEAHQQALTETFENTPLLFYRSTNWEEYVNHTDSGIFWEAFERSHGRIPLPQECQRFEDDFQTRYDTITQHTAISEVEGASTLLKALASHDQFFVAFATRSYRGAAEHKLKRLGVTTHDEVPLVTASEFNTRHEIVSAAASFAISAGVNKIVSVGDGPWDYKTAQDLNYDFIVIPQT